jgi:starvation-inducible DNA-binding protein
MKPVAEFPNQNNEVIITFLNLLLAEEYVLYTKTRTAHWNVDGLNNFELHVFLENQYTKLDEIIDEIAVRIRSLGHFALGSLKDFLSISHMSVGNDDLSNSEQAFDILLQDHESIIRMIHHEIGPISNQLNDADIAQFLSPILAEHQKMVWHLNGLLVNAQFNKNNSTQTQPMGKFIEIQD